MNNTQRFERALDRAWFGMRMPPNPIRLYERTLRKRRKELAENIFSHNALLGKAGSGN